MRVIGREGAGAPDAAVAAAIHAALLAATPRIASAHLYDTLGSLLFEAITHVPEYYPTRTEAAIMGADGESMAAAVRGLLGPDFQIVDLGAGSCVKGEALLGVMQPSRYVAVDVAADFLATALERVAAQHRSVAMEAVAVDFAAGFTLPAALADRPTLYFWPGSSISNFAPDTAAAFVSGLDAGDHAAALLLGVDLVKPAAVLEAAYDDAAGVTAAFNRNVLQHVNRLAGTDFALANWRHVAVWNAAESRIEMWLEAACAQAVHWPGGGRDFAAGERILTEISVKWSDALLADLWRSAVASPVADWRDGRGWFAVQLLRLQAPG